ncbi:hypothetical protein B0I37DRAFT_357424 [Chaetomium sp. MPI-CAGE-AT-0009]|nr:hypothetical protein B0I37DRAFT_357424 [Chaetomium sp. MPI-CAGE-AT-0009]
MGRPQQPDEHLPEVAQTRPPLTPNAHGDHLPEVVPDTSPEAAQPRNFMETDKYPAQYDTAPKLLHEEPTTPGMSPGQQYQQPWGPGSIVGGDYHSVSALSPNSDVPWHSFPPGADDQKTYVGSEPETERRICGLRRRHFGIIAVIIGIIVVAAAVGGGVGGAMAARQTDEAAPAETNSTSASGSTGRTSTAPSSSVTDLNDQTDPSVFEMFEFQAWSETNYKGETTPILKEPGFYDLDIDAISYYWVHNKTDCCVTFCKDHEVSTGYLCDPKRQPVTDKQITFRRVSLWCGNRLNTEWHTKCSR